MVVATITIGMNGIGRIVLGRKDNIGTVLSSGREATNAMVVSYVVIEDRIGMLLAVSGLGSDVSRSLDVLLPTDGFNSFGDLAVEDVSDCYPLARADDRLLIRSLGNGFFKRIVCCSTFLEGRP